MTKSKHIRIEVYDDDNFTNTTVTEFIVIKDNIMIIDYYLEALDFYESFYAVYIDGELDRHTTLTPPTQD